MNRLTLPTILLLASLPATAHAASVQFTLDPYGIFTAGKWSLMASVSADNAGLASYSAALTNYTAPVSRTPIGVFMDSSAQLADLPTGFDTNRIATTSAPLSASLNTLSGTDYILTGF